VHWLALVVLVAPIALACAGSRFEAARAQDTAAAYHRYLREHPDSRYAEEARQRLEFVRIRSKPSVEGYQAFEKRWPQSPLLAELRVLVAEPAFAQARGRGTAQAYREFLEEFGESPYAQRARGNAAYVEARGLGGRPEALADFAARHPESDFAAEAARSAASLEARARSGFRRAGLVIEFSPSTPGKDRLARVFAERAVESFGAAGVELVPLTGADDPGAASLPACLTIRHEEGAVGTQLADGRMSSGGFAAETTVTLARRGDPEPIWSRATRFRTDAAPALEDTSVLFGPGTRRFWSSFFIPVATWNTRAAVRIPHELDAQVVAVEATGGRGIVLFDNGSFRLVDLGDPEAPWPLADYSRPRDHAKFGGLRLFGDRVVIFGEDGIEVVLLSAEGPRLLLAHDRGMVGSILAVEPLDGRLVAGGKRGLLLIPEQGAAQVLVPRPIHGLARVGEHLVFSDGSSLFVSTLALLREGRVEAQLQLEPGVSPGEIRLTGHSAVVLTARGALRLDLSEPAAPRLLSRIDAVQAGALEDAVVVGGQVFLLGERGLQLVDRSGARVAQSADVRARARLDSMGRHVVLVGENWLQVVDTTPFLASPAAAAPPASDSPDSASAE
jgi:hypothetical protein